MLDKSLMKARIQGNTDSWASSSEVEEMVNAVDNIITWHPYPQEKPTENGQYIITGFDKIKFVCSSMYHTEFGWAFLKDDMVLAWAELPKPYEGADK